MDKQPMYRQEKCWDKFQFRVSSRQEAIERLTEIINSLKHDHSILVTGSILCESVPCAVLDSALFPIGYEVLPPVAQLCFSSGGNCKVRIHK